MVSTKIACNVWHLYSYYSLLICRLWIFLQPSSFYCLRQKKCPIVYVGIEPMEAQMTITTGLFCHPKIYYKLGPNAVSFYLILILFTIEFLI